MVEICFWKMHGLGNDYIVIDNRSGLLKEDVLRQLAKKMCKRRFSIGADGLLLIYDSKIADVRMRVFNADGSEAEMCGNGIRCVAKYCYENKIVPKKHFQIETLAGVKNVWLETSNGEVKTVTVDMGSPVFSREKIPVLGKGKFIRENLNVDGEVFEATCLSVGNPHCVIFVDDVKKFPVRHYGPKIENHPLFPNRINVEFVQIINKNLLKVRVWERGVGETFACGTGACASVVAGHITGRVNRECTVQLLGGELKVKYRDDDKIFMSGVAETVYRGTINLGDIV